EELRSVARALGNVPAGFNLHKKLEKTLEYRRTCIDQNKPLDWSIGELFAYGTLLLENHAVRLTGQDVERGTFSHRHAVVFDQVTGDPYIALNHLDAVQSKFCVHNSPLTESACVGFEYGYSLADPKMLILWEAQFGDFCNGAQVIIDQFLASAEAKWQRHSGLTLLLPHGYEGAGPEHSSARLERFLQLCADHNMEVVYPTTPAQMFHMLRRQMKRNFRKPLIVMTPKSLLRNPRCVSSVQDLTHGTFQWVLDDTSIADPSRVTQINFCSGKVYYDMLEYRESVGRTDVALVRIEQLYPFPEAELERVLARYPENARLVYVQEEPRNMGAYRHVSICFKERLDVALEYVGRDPKASPAVASEKMHKQEQQKIMVAAIGLPHGSAPAEASTSQGATKPADKAATAQGGAPQRGKGPSDARAQLQPAHKK
ncbi:MAG TPA: hypothetical protein VG711_01635, partial [Phycisphaerales bacterium]|nr:hypothetical protein [Phycisphaerales bacterium]